MINRRKLKKFGHIIRGKKYETLQVIMRNKTAVKRDPRRGPNS